ncbi:hypothetical protein J7K18_08515 [bacterium]|nr:hypothetical protein [bacterium]
MNQILSLFLALSLLLSSCQKKEKEVPSEYHLRVLGPISEIQPKEYGVRANAILTSKLGNKFAEAKSGAGVLVILPTTKGGKLTFSAYTYVPKGKSPKLETRVAVFLGVARGPKTEVGRKLSETNLTLLSENPSVLELGEGGAIVPQTAREITVDIPKGVFRLIVLSDGNAATTNFTFYPAEQG